MQTQDTACCQFEWNHGWTLTVVDCGSPLRSGKSSSRPTIFLGFQSLSTKESQPEPILPTSLRWEKPITNEKRKSRQIMFQITMKSHFLLGKTSICLHQMTISLFSTPRRSPATAPRSRAILPAAKGLTAVALPLNDCWMAVTKLFFRYFLNELC